MNERVYCKGNGEPDTRCEYDGAWFCRDPECRSPVLTSTLLGARPSGCPIYDEWNRRKSENE